MDGKDLTEPQCTQNEVECVRIEGRDMGCSIGNEYSGDIVFYYISGSCIYVVASKLD